MSITINLEIGHDASVRTKTTPEGFTHDWEVYVKGCNGAEIHYYVEKVVFHLHETFPKPKRVVKEPPYSLRTSGYAGFLLPIDLYLRNTQEPKKISFIYDLQLQPRGPPIHNVQKEKYVFHAPSEEFRTKLLKGGAVVGTVGATQESSDSKVIDEKNQMTSKPKLSGSEMARKPKIKPEEPRNSDFLNLFGTPITKTTSKTPEPPKPKEVTKSTSKLDKPADKDKSKTKSPHKDKEKSKDKDKSSESSEKKKDEKKKSKEDKSKDKDKSKEKSSKKDKERDKSPPARPRSPSPKRSPKRPVSPSPPKHSSSKEKEQSKDDKKDKERKEEKKNKKEKREHRDSKHKDRDKEKEHKEHKSRESKSSKESVKEKDISPAPIAASQPQKTEKKIKEKEPVKEPKEEEKVEKTRQEKSDDKQKHKHKKKDRKEKHSKTEKKLEKQSVTVPPVKEDVNVKEIAPVSSSRESDKSNLFGSPKSDPPSTPNQNEPKIEKASSNLTFRDDETSNDSVKVSSREPSPAPRVRSKSPPSPAIENLIKTVKKPEPEKKKEESPKKKEKKEKKKDKKSERDHEKKRKRKSPATHAEAEQPPEKLSKEEENNNSDDERKVSSTEDAKPPVKIEADDYMGMLRDLQHKIMGLKDNSDLQKVVQLIAETGRYEVSAHTFDFDLCLLDRSTVRQLQEFFSTIS